jgi:ribosomal-protein-serine acetyltransferase
MEEETLTLHVDDDILLRQLEGVDVEALHQLMTQEFAYLSHWLAAEELYRTRQEVESFIFFSSMRYVMNGAFDAGVWYRGQLAGMVSLHTINPMKRRSDIGYWLARPFQGKGIMTRSVCRVLACAFAEYGLAEMRIYVGAGNAKSRAIPERLGFTLEKITPEAERINGKLVDNAVYLLHSREWEGNT